MVNIDVDKEIPYISVVITAYNRKDFLLSAIKSVLNQSLDRKFFEIILIKNYEIEEIDKLVYSNNIKSIIMDASIGHYLCTSVNECRGEVVVFLDDDDMFAKNKLEYIFQSFKKNKNLVYLHNNARYINSKGTILKQIHRNNIDFNMSSISIRKCIINLSILDGIYTAPDTLMYLFSLKSKGKIINSNFKLTYYRSHNENTSISLEWHKKYKEQLKNFYIIVNDKKERYLLDDHIFTSSIIIDLKENREMKFKDFIYDIFYLFISLNRHILVLLLKCKFRELYKKSITNFN